MIKFGPAGNSESFTSMGYKNNFDVPQYLVKMGLNAYEYQCGRGVRVSDENAAKFGAIAAESGIAVSLHAPYYISLSSTEEEKRDGSIKYILDSARACKAMGGQRIIVHSGSATKITREHALELALGTMKKAITALDENGYEDIIICPETMGKVGQLGTLEEVLELCKLDERMLPCIDFGHLNARTFGGVKTKDDFKEILDKIENALGAARLKVFHSHFSKIEFSSKGGEVRHLTFEDTVYGPEFSPLAELIVQKGLTPTFICESAGTQAEDARTMKNIVESLQK